MEFSDFPLGETVSSFGLAAAAMPPGFLSALRYASSVSSARRHNTDFKMRTSQTR
jgi:hypothetical protein